MDRKAYISEMQSAGWVLWRHSRQSATSSFVCKHIGCKGAKIVTDDQILRSRSVKPCTLPHYDQRHAAEPVATYAALVQHLRNRRLRMGLSQEEIEAASGLAFDHIGKLEILDRIGTFPTMIAWAETLGMEIALVPKAIPDQVLAIIDHKAGRPVPARRLPACQIPSDAPANPSTLSVLQGIAS